MGKKSVGKSPKIQIGPRDLRRHEKRYMDLAKLKWQRITRRKRGFPAEKIKCVAYIGNHQRYYVRFSYKGKVFSSAKALVEHMTRRVSQG